jgi:hypothetical protein
MSYTGLNESLIKVKSLFFDREAVIRCVDKTILKNLSWIGGYIRRVAKNSIKKAKSYHAASAVGKPPLSHTGLLKNFIFSSFDKSKDSVVVGPVLLKTKGKNAPHNLEYGGQTTMQRRAKTKQITIRPRPYMRPAMDASQGKIAQIWKNSVSK